MYLDDGVSRASAPSSTFLSEKNHNILLTQDNKTLIRGYFGDKEAENAFTLYRITQVRLQAYVAFPTIRFSTNMYHSTPNHSEWKVSTQPTCAT